MSSSPSAPPGREALADPRRHRYRPLLRYRRATGVHSSDVRQARVRFAAECLAFSIPPSNAAIENEFGCLAACRPPPAWKAAVPRDNGSSWDFEDVRDHYVQTLFGEDPVTVRWSDPERYLDLGRAPICEAFARDSRLLASARFGMRRRVGARAAMDLEPGPGGGSSTRRQAEGSVVRDAAVSKPVALLLADDGLDGLRLDAINETDRPGGWGVRVRVHTRSVWSRGFDVPATGRLPARGPPVVGRHGARAFHRPHARLHVRPPRIRQRHRHAVETRTRVVDEVVHLVGKPGPAPRTHRRPDGGRAAGGVRRRLGRRRRTRTVPRNTCHLELCGFEPADSWFHLPPGGARTCRCAGPGQAETVIGHVRALNSHCRRPGRTPSGRLIRTPVRPCAGIDEAGSVRNSAAVTPLLALELFAAVRHHCSGVRRCLPRSSLPSPRPQTPLAGLAEDRAGDAVFAQVTEAIGAPSPRHRRARNRPGRSWPRLSPNAPTCCW